MVNDHEGNTYSNIKEMCAHYGISQSLYSHRKSRGFTLKECLLGKIKAQDYKGQVFPSIKEMCAHYGISVPLYKARVQRGITGKDLFSKERLDPLPKDNITDHKGNKYSSILKMCEAYGINRSTYLQRIEKGLSVEDALTLPVETKRSGSRQIEDFKGIVYNSKKEMCEAYGIKYITLVNRMNLGWSLEDALTVPVSLRKKGKR